MRQRILYAEQIWRQQRFFAFFLLAVGPIAAGFLYFTHDHRFSDNVRVFLLYIPGGLLLLAALFYYRYRSHIQAREDGLKVSNLLSSIVVPYEEIRLVRVQPLRTAFQDRRKLGSRMAYEDFIVVPIPDPDQAASHLNARLPEKQGVNLGGGRRKKRRR